MEVGLSFLGKRAAMYSSKDFTRVCTGVLFATMLASCEVNISFTNQQRLAITCITSSVNVETPDYAFTETGSMAQSGYSQTLVKLSDGKILIFGGVSKFEQSAEIYDPETGLFTETYEMNNKRLYGTGSLLPDGRVLLAGGYDTTDARATKTTEIYSPMTGKFVNGPDMVEPKYDFTATALNNGTILLVGGWNSNNSMSSAQIYNPVSGTFTTVGSLNKPRTLHTASLLPDGRVIIIGGFNGTTYLNDAEIYNPTTMVFSLLKTTMSDTRSAHQAVILSDGRIFISGGHNTSTLSSTAIYNPSTGLFTATAHLPTAVYGHTATLLPNGKVLILGGYNSYTNLSYSNAEFYDPETNTYEIIIKGLGFDVCYHRAILLNNDRVLITGGYRVKKDIKLDSAYLFSAGDANIIPGELKCEGSGGDGNYTYSIKSGDGKIDDAGLFNTDSAIKTQSVTVQVVDGEGTVATTDINVIID